MDHELNSLTTDPTPDSATRWYLTAQLTDFDSVQVVDIDCSPFHVGRRLGLSLTLPHPAVSYMHAEVLVEDDHLVIKDLGSTNGTFHNGKRIAGPTVFQEGDLVKFADVLLQVNKRPLVPPGPLEGGKTPADGDLSLSDFDRFLRMRTVVPYFQPLISLKDGSMVGCEVLARSRIRGLRTPEEMFQAASRLNLQAELSRNLRLIGFEKGAMLWHAPGLFINTHAEELATYGLLESLRRIREISAELPITIEIREPDSRNTEAIQRFREALAGLKMGLAYDRFGSGQTRRAELATVRPDYVKFDMHLIREIHLAPTGHQALLANLVHMVQELGIVAVAVGVESEYEHLVCREVGFELGQGFYYGRPSESISPTTCLDLGSK